MLNAAGINGQPETTDVLLDAQIKAKQLPPPPFKGMVKSASTTSALMMYTIVTLLEHGSNACICMESCALHSHVVQGF